MSASKGGASINTVGANGAASKSFDMANTDMMSSTQIMASGSTAAIVLAGVTPPYRAVFVNMSTTAIEVINIGNANANPITSIVSALRAGDKCCVTVPIGTVLYAHSESGTPSLFYSLCEL